MWKSISLICFLFGTVLCVPKPGLGRSKIVGGKTASSGSLPYQVSIELNGYHWCGGSIIAPDLILTAAHCTYDMSEDDEIAVRAGTTERQKGGQLIKVEKFVQHKGFDWEHTDYDVALLKLEKPLKFDKYVQPIKLVKNNKYLQRSKAVATVSGWGHTKEGGDLSDDLQVANIPLLKKEKCKKLIGSRFTENMLCAGLDEGKVDACQSDSGGPLVVNRKLAGVVSWGIGCARKGKPGVYADVVPLSSWINENIEKLKK